MKYRLLGQTGLRVSVLGLGTTKFGRNQAVKYPKPFDLPSETELCNLLATAKALGVNFIDTAPAYGSSEARLGNLLKGQRHDWIIATKVGEEFADGVSSFDFSAQHLRASVHRSLQRLQTDYLDIVLVHSNGEDLQLLEQYDVLGTLKALQQQGLMRAIGLSTKTVAGGLATVAHADCVMLTYHPEALTEASVIKAAQQQGKGVLIKKALASGHAALNTSKHALSERFNFILQSPAVSSIVVGTLNPQHLTENAQTLCYSREDGNPF